jgi:hypothetical protein
MNKRLIILLFILSAATLIGNVMIERYMQYSEEDGTRPNFADAAKKIDKQVDKVTWASPPPPAYAELSKPHFFTESYFRGDYVAIDTGETFSPEYSKIKSIKIPKEPRKFTYKVWYYDDYGNPQEVKKDIKELYYKIKGIYVFRQENRR